MFRKYVHALGRDEVGQWLLITGGAKVGKTHAACSVYEHFKPEEVLFVSCYETDGFLTAENIAKGKVFGFDCQELMNERSPVQTLFGILDSVDSSIKAVVFDSIDGASRWFESVLFRSKNRRDRETGVGKMDQPAHGKKLNFIRELVMDVLYPLTMRGIHVVVTCGLAPRDYKDGEQTTTRFNLDLSGQNSWQVPRYFSDVCKVIPTGRGRETVISFKDGQTNDLGSRRGYPERLSVPELGKFLFESGAIPRDRHDAKPPEEEFINLKEGYKLQAGDIAVTAEDLDACPWSLSDWHERAWAEAMKRKKEGNPVTGHQKALVKVAYETIKESYVVRFLDLGLVHHDGTHVEEMGLSKLKEAWKKHQELDRLKNPPKNEPKENKKEDGPLHACRKMKDPSRNAGEFSREELAKEQAKSKKAKVKGGNKTKEAAKKLNKTKGKKEPKKFDKTSTHIKNRASLRNWEQGRTDSKPSVDSCPFEEVQARLEQQDVDFDLVATVAHVQNRPVFDLDSDSLPAIREAILKVIHMEEDYRVNKSEILAAKLNLAKVLSKDHPDERKEKLRKFLKESKVNVPRAGTFFGMLEKTPDKAVVEFNAACNQ